MEGQPTYEQGFDIRKKEKFLAQRRTSLIFKFK